MVSMQQRQAPGGPINGPQGRPQGRPGRPAAGSRRARHSRRDSGFTLLEVLVALTVLSVMLIALHQSYASNIYIQSFNRSLWKAVLYSQNELLQIERLSPPPVSIRNGEYDDDHPLAGYAWKREVVDESPMPGITVRRVSLELSWVEGNAERSYSAEIYVMPK